MPIFTDSQLRELGTKIFEAVGVQTDEAALVANCLVKSNLRGMDSHGVMRIPVYVQRVQKGIVKPGAKAQLIKGGPAMALFDGGKGFGYSIATEVMKDTIKRAKDVGVAFSGVRNIDHLGRVGEWPEMALEQDMIGIASQPGMTLIAPWGGVERRLPIAPVAIAIPTGKYPPILIDMALGPMAGGRSKILGLRKQKVPLGWLIDGEGKLTEDPGPFNRGEGAQLPLGQTGVGYKGMALALVVDVLCGPLVGAFQRRGVFFEVINVDMFTPIDEFKKGMDDIITKIKSSKLAPGFKEILMPGEPDWREEEKRLKEGIFVDDEIWESIVETAKKLGVSTSEYQSKPGKAEIAYPSYTLKDQYRT
jgi:LDH2 family malate/lactate/ureidoglycolate dehydrogenase